MPFIPIKYKTETVHVEDTFLKTSDPKVERKLRKRVRNIIQNMHFLICFAVNVQGLQDSYIYIYSTTQYKKPRDSMTDQEFENDGIEIKRQISSREFILLFEEKDPLRKTLNKIRQCFIYEQE